MAGGRNRPSVVFLTHHLPWPVCSGGRLREAELLSRLAPRFDVELIAISKMPDLDLAHVREAARHGVQARVFPAQPSNVSRTSSHVRRHQSGAARAYLDRRLAEVDDTVVHVEGHYLLNLLPSAAQRQTLIVEHNVESTLFAQRARLSTDPVERQGLLDDANMTRCAERSAWRTARMVGAVTDDDARLIQEAVPGIHIKVIPDGADHLRSATPSFIGRESTGRLLFVANLAYQPNEDAAHLLVTEIFPEVLHHCPGATLVIVGPSPPRWLQDVARCQPRIRVTGWVPDIAAWLDAAEVVVCPLRVGGGVKVKILEALARGRAVVTTPIGLQGLSHLPAGAAIECRDLATIIEACVTLLTYPEERHRQQVRAAAAAKQLPTWDEAADMLASAWTMLAAPPTPEISTFAGHGPAS